MNGVKNKTRRFVYVDKTEVSNKMRINRLRFDSLQLVEISVCPVYSTLQVKCSQKTHFVFIRFLCNSEKMGGNSGNLLIFHRFIWTI